MRILFLTFYYPPDLCAGSFRAEPLVAAMRQAGGESLHIDVFTTLPNRYQSHLAAAPEHEEAAGLAIHRIALPSHQSGMADQALAFRRFAAQVMKQTAGQRWDLVVATSSRLMTAALGAHIARRVGAPLYLDIRDLFTDTMSDLLSGRALVASVPFFKWLERRTLRSARVINVVSEGFLDHARAVAPDPVYRAFTNGIDEEFLSVDFRKVERGPGDLPLIVYAGNMGDGQGLHNIVPQAAKRLEGQANFRIIGDGGRRNQLQQAITEAGLTNVEILPAMPRVQLFDHYRQADILFLHLNDHAAFRKVLPSKLFEYAATGKKMLAGVAGYPAEFLATQVPGVAVFAPCDADGLVRAFDQLEAIGEPLDRAAFCARFSRQTIMREMADDILATGSR